MFYSLEKLNTQLSSLKLEEGTQVFNAHVSRVTKQIETEKAESAKPINIMKNGHTEVDGRNREWTLEEHKLLEQALKTYPSCNPHRWTQVAELIPGRSRIECIARFKSACETGKPTSNKNGYGDQLEPEADVVQNREWTVDEQKLLEQALKTYSSTSPDRWTQVAACIPGRSKKECMTRFKVGRGMVACFLFKSNLKSKYLSEL
jgi:DnaJ family protein C protein 2